MGCIFCYARAKEAVKIERDELLAMLVDIESSARELSHKEAVEVMSHGIASIKERLAR